MSEQAKPDDRNPTEDASRKAAEMDETVISEGRADADYEALVRLMKENEEFKDRALRLAAEMENLRRRTTRDVADARSYAIANFARDMLAVSDNLRRALESVPSGDAAGGEVSGSSLSGLVDGVEMTERAMLSALERHGVRKLDPQGERFDPNFHQAMFEAPNADVPANTVVQVVQSGYSIGERVLRPAMVGVSKGGPSAEAKPSAAPEEKPEPNSSTDVFAEKDEA